MARLKKLKFNNTSYEFPVEDVKVGTTSVVTDGVATIDLSGKADDNAVVKLTGNQTIAGTKTFSTSPVVPSKTTAATNTGTAIATEAQVYLKADASDVNTKTFNLSSSSDTTTMAAICSYIESGKNAIVKYGNTTYQLYYINSSEGLCCYFYALKYAAYVSPSWRLFSLKINRAGPIDEPDYYFSTNELNLNTKADVDSVLTKTNTTSFTPTGDYQPATKKYVDDNKTEYNAGTGIEILDIYSAMQGPAPDGFHVPLNTEWKAVYDIWTALGGGSSDGTNFGIALKLPFAGNRNYSSAGINYQDSYGRYWSSTRYNNKQAYGLELRSTVIDPQHHNGRSYGYSVRCFKDTPTIPTSSWTKLYGTSIEAGGIFWSSTDGLISLSSDGQTWITIADKNLGATQVWNSGDTLSQANMGNMYQWGNNYGFPSTGTISNTSSTQVDASNYGPGNYYSSDTFIKYNGSWDSTDNGNLWGGVTGVVTDAITNTGVLSVNGQTGDVTIQSSGGIQNDTTGTTTTVTKIRAGTEAEYALITPNATTIYYVF